MIRIKTDKTGSPATTEITTESGERIFSVSAATISLGVDQFPSVYLELVDAELDILATPRLPLDIVREVAAEHGYALVRHNKTDTA